LTTAALLTIANHTTNGLRASVPAVTAWSVASPNRAKLERWTARQTDRGSLRISNDVTSTATST
jgi:hypothetical protein